MYVKRTAQLRLLEEQYAAAGNNLVILYGRKGMGKTMLLTEFLKGKPAAFYYEGSECVDRLQLLLMNRRLSGNSNDEEALSYPPLLYEVIGTRQEKTIVVLDEFHYIIKNSPDFIESFRLLYNQDRPVMFILCSSSIRWVENEMVKDLGDFALSISAYLKLKEFSFVDFVTRFPKSPVETCIYINAILGGVPEYLEEWQESKSVKENIKSILLDKNSRLFTASGQFLKLELREPAVYDTILYLLAQGNRKLNDLHAKTGFSRAKIIVYLKNLMQLDLVEKLIPLNDTGRENVQKGLYRIKDNFFSFWFRFVFPNHSELMLGEMEKVYEEKVAPYLNEYIQEYFADVCTEYLKLMNQHKRLKDTILWWDRWYGKSGTIDILAKGEQGGILTGKCLWEDREADLTDYETLISLTAEAGKKPDYCYIFSKMGFSGELKEFALQEGNISLIGLEEF